MKFLEKISPELSLRLGLGAMYLYSGYSLMTEPRSWYAFVPQWFHDLITPVMSMDSHLRLQGGFELLIGLVLIAWFLPRNLARLAAFTALLEMASILVFVGIDLITFRDLGLLGGLAALVNILNRKE